MLHSQSIPSNVFLIAKSGFGGKGGAGGIGGAGGERLIASGVLGERKSDGDFGAAGANGNKGQDGANGEDGLPLEVIQE